MSVDNRIRPARSVQSVSSRARHVALEVGMTRMSERRNATRNRTFKAGKIVLNDGRSVIDCTVRNMSGTGASIGVVNAIAVPAEFSLEVDGSLRSCVVAWRRLDRLGIKFQ
jgi:hypothetical protein